jgi:signal transduction histidine kinase
MWATMKPKFAYIYIAFVISVIVLVAVSVLFYRGYNKINAYSADISAKYHIIAQLHELQVNVKAMENYSRGYIITNDRSFIDSFPSLERQVELSFDSVQTLLKDNTAQLSSVLLLRNRIKRRVNILQQNNQRASIGDTTGLYASVLEGKRLMEAFRKEVKDIEVRQTIEREEKYAERRWYEIWTPNPFLFIIIFSLVITLVSFYFILKEVRTRVRYQTELEKRVNELNRSTAELEQFTFVASHDLQEPLRKIRTFSDRLLIKHRHELNDEAKMIMDRIDVAANRMQEMIQDMVKFTNLVVQDEESTLVDLNYITEKILNEYKGEGIKEPIVHKDLLPVLIGYPSQLYMLFRAIIDNSIKFAKPGEHPVIHFVYEEVQNVATNGQRGAGKTYHTIKVEDKGIGFDNEFADKIFMIFQRLHTQQSQYRGKGMGLAIAQRVMANHNGFIVAKGELGVGATIQMFFPANN